MLASCLFTVLWLFIYLLKLRRAWGVTKKSSKICLWAAPQSWLVYSAGTQKGAGRVCLIDVLLSGSLLRDPRRQPKGGGGRLCVHPGQLFHYRQLTHDLQVSRDTRSKMLLRRGYESIHALPVRWRTKTLWGAEEFDRRLGPSGFVLTVCAGSPSFFCFPANRGEGHRGRAVVVRARTPPLLGWLTKKMAARVDGVTIQLSGHPERCKPTSVDLAHG